MRITVRRIDAHIDAAPPGEPAAFLLAAMK
jgi:hypothetical protein